MNDISKILIERGKQHGDYANVSRIAQSIKEVYRSAPNWEKLPDAQKEALELIATKQARILSGDSGLRDHWEDIGGYAELGSQYGKSNSNVTFDLRKAMARDGLNAMPQVEKAS
mgnify:CR=1 FL=1